MCRLQTCPRTNVDPPRFLPLSNCRRRVAYRLAAPAAIPRFEIKRTITVQYISPFHQSCTIPAGVSALVQQSRDVDWQRRCGPLVNLSEYMPHGTGRRTDRQTPKRCFTAFRCGPDVTDNKQITIGLSSVVNQ